MAAHNPANFAKLCLETGLCKQTILSGLSKDHTLGILNMFLLDIMHFVTLNDSDLFTLDAGRIIFFKKKTGNIVMAI